MFYVKKPIPVKVLQLTPDNEKYLLDNGWVDAVVYDGDHLSHAFINTLEGVMRSDYGDYIVEGIKNEHWSIKKDIFEQTYEPYDIEKHQIDSKGNPPDFKKGQKVVISNVNHNSDCGYIGVVDHQKYTWDQVAKEYNWSMVVIKINGYKQSYEKHEVVSLKS